MESAINYGERSGETSLDTRVESLDNLPRLHARQLRFRYLVALSLIAVLTVLSQIVVQYLIADQAHDSRVVNIAGRQRMLSQKITKTVGYLVGESKQEEVDATRGQLAAALDLWERSHGGLQQGDERLGLPGRNSEAVTTLFAEIEPHYRAMVAAVKSVLSPLSERAAITEALADIRQHESEFLKGMDAIVFKYDSEAKSKVTFARWLELALMVVTLVVLVLEARLIFAPAVRQIRRDMGELEARESDLKNLFAASPTAMLLADSSNLSILMANRKACEVIGIPPDNLESRLLSEYVDAQHRVNKGFLDRLLDGQTINEYEVVLLDANRSVVEALASVRKTLFASQEVYIVGITNVSELKKAQQMLEYYATFDELTGLVNRRAGLTILEKMVAQASREQRALAVAYVDLDGLKAANDRHGHAEGDWLIQAVSEVLVNAIRKGDLAARLGGDEFLIILHDCTADGAAIFAQRVDAALAGLQGRHAKSYPISVSMGIAAYDRSCHATALELLVEADKLMYESKQRKKRALDG